MAQYRRRKVTPPMPHGLVLYNFMERSSRKRARVTTLEVVREKEQEEDVTLKLKSSKKDSKDPILLLEETSSAEEEESILETLLLLEDSMYSGIVSSLHEALTCGCLLRN